MRRLLRALRWILPFAGLSAAVALTCSYQEPDPHHFTLRYRGIPPALPATFTLHEQWLPLRSVPFVSETPRGLLEPASDIIDYDRRPVAAKPEGVELELNLRRTWSLGQYRLQNAFLEADAERPGGGGWFRSGQGGPREWKKLGNGVVRVDYHFLDVATSPSSFRVRLPYLDGTRDGQVTIDFDPIAYVSFVGLHEHEEWSQAGWRCGVSRVLLSRGIPRTFRYETFALPPPGPGAPAPKAEGVPEVFLADSGATQEGRNERVTPEGWAKLREARIEPSDLRFTHDPEARTITVEYAGTPAPGDVMERKDAILVIAAPSTDGRWFGYDCLRFEAEERGEPFNPAVYTLFSGLPHRGPREFRSKDWGVACADPESPRFELSPRAPTVIRYETAVRESWAGEAAGQPIPKPRGETEAFLVKLESLKGMSERVEEGDWDALRRKAVEMPGVRLRHDAAAKTIEISVPEPVPGDVALVVGTRSSDHRFFGFDCVRLAPRPPGAH